MGATNVRKGLEVFEVLAEYTNGGLMAHAGGGQANAIQLGYGLNRVLTVASAGDSAKLPGAVPGTRCGVKNATAGTSMDVYPASGQSINLLSADTALAHAANTFKQFVCITAGIWEVH